MHSMVFPRPVPGCSSSRSDVLATLVEPWLISRCKALVKAGRSFRSPIEVSQDPKFIHIGSAVFLRGPRRYGALGSGWACRRAYWPLRGPVCPGAKSRRRGRCAQPVRPARAWLRSPSRASQTNSSATVYVAGVLLGLDSLGVGGNRRLAVALVSFCCLTCLFDGCLTIV